MSLALWGNRSMAFAPKRMEYGYFFNDDIKISGILRTFVKTRRPRGAKRVDILK